MRSSYDRIFLYRCVAQHVSPKPERFIQADLMTKERRGEIANALNGFCRKHLDGGKGKKADKWRRDLGRRLAVEMTDPESPDEG